MIYGMINPLLNFNTIKEEFYQTTNWENDYQLNLLMNAWIVFDANKILDSEIKLKLKNVLESIFQKYQHHSMIKNFLLKKNITFVD